MTKFDRVEHEELLDDDRATASGGGLSRWDTWTCDIAGGLAGTLAGTFLTGFAGPEIGVIGGITFGNSVKNLCLYDYEFRINVPPIDEPRLPNPNVEPAPVFEPT